MISVLPFGQLPCGDCSYVYEITRPETAVRVRVCDFGATLVGLDLPNADGMLADVVLGYGSVKGYAGTNGACYGATIGPSANRVAGAKVTIDGHVCHLATNEGDNNLHTDLVHGLHKRLWTAEDLHCEDVSKSVDHAANTAISSDACTLVLSCTLADGELGLPGNRRYTAMYALEPSGELTVSYYCETDASTFVNMTNHAYFNLGGHAAGSIRDHMVRIRAEHYLPIREDSIPTGELAPVGGTPFDLRDGAVLHVGLDAQTDQIARARGFDHCFVVDDYAPGAAPRQALHAEDPASGRALDILITTPGIQLYTGNWLDDANAKDDETYTPHAGFAAEPEFYPDCIHHTSWPQPICTPEQSFTWTTVYRPSVINRR